MRHHHEDDDEHILKDGERMRVPMHMMDGDSFDPIQRAVARSVRVTDGSGQGGVNLNRPGFRIAATDAVQALDDAYASYERDLTTAWQGDCRSDVADARRKKTTHYDPRGRLAGHSETEEWEEDEEQEKHGTERQTSDAAMRARDKAYADYDATLREAWRAGK
jgi:hypothetical protein